MEMDKAKKEEPDPKLMEVLGFTAEDLQANREGYLTKVQRERLNSQRRSSQFDYLFLFIVPLAGAALLMLADGASVGTTMFIGLAILLAYGIFNSVMRYSSYRQFDADLYKGNIQAVEGEIRKNSAFSLGRSLDETFRIEIGKLSFPVKETTISAFKSHQSYRIYYVPNTKTILSAEMIEE